MGRSYGRRKRRRVGRVAYYGRGRDWHTYFRDDGRQVRRRAEGCGRRQRMLKKITAPEGTAS